jgi:hypothetical protein
MKKQKLTGYSQHLCYLYRLGIDCVLNREYTELTEKDHKVKSDLKDVEKNLSEWTAQNRVVVEKIDAISAEVVSRLLQQKLYPGNDFMCCLYAARGCKSGRETC